MKKYLHILVLVTLLTLGSAAKAQNPFDLPMVCSGLVEEYWVKGFNGSSDFEWTITNPDGQPVSSNLYTILGRGDTIQVYWSPDLTGGIYTFRVMEHTAYGCIGEVYTQNILLNSYNIYLPFDGVPESVAVCLGDTAELDPGLFSSYIWQDGSSSRIFFTGQAGTYQVQLVNSQHECTYNQIEAFVNPLPLVNLGNDTILFGAQELVLDVNDPNINFYEWSTGSILPSITVGGGTGRQVVSVTVTDRNGCVNSDTIKIDAENYNALKFPRAFTPNGDGFNDTWKFPFPTEFGADISAYLDNVEIRVFNRWGKRVWQWDGPFREWNGRDNGGRELPMDSYHYIVRIIVDGKTFNYKGTVTIVR